MNARVSNWITRGFPLWSCLSAVLAIYHPPLFLWFGSDAIGWGLGLIMLGMGMTLRPEDFLRVWRAPKVIALGVGLQFLVMPGWSAFLAWALKLPPEMAVGLILVACCPGGTASNVVVFLAKARVALSVSITLCSTLVAVLLTPWLTYLYAGHYLPIDPWALFNSIVVIVLLPLAIGVGWNQWLPKSARKVAVFSPSISVLFILLIVGFVLADKRDLILAHGWMILGATGLLHLGGFLGGYWGAKWLGRDELDKQTLSIEVGMQNSGLGAALATKNFSSMPMTPAPCALSAILHCMIGSFLASWWSRRNIKSTELEEDS
ncbi:MAG: bile acid:sodium symporter family protein [Opitutales bacterium]|nr:bile acid:sodium symporter family protein [Opitutales bacterium]